jgi:flagellar biosynthetic protein FliP
MNKRRLSTILVCFAFVFFAGVVPAFAQFTVPAFDFIKEAQGSKETMLSLQILFLLTVLSLGPSILIMTTCFTRIAIVLSFLKQALGAREIPPSQIIIGLSLFLTAFIMMPVWQDINKNALIPFSNGKMTQEQAFNNAKKPLRIFMLKQTREKDIALFVYAAKTPKPKRPDDVPLPILIPAFIISELRTAFIIGFVIYIPFLIIDMVVSSILMAMGMMMLPPAMVSLPFKLIVFVLIDGWYLIIKSLIGSFSL